jgi:TetR/AcrR family transcriptional regulator
MKTTEGSISDRGSQSEPRRGRRAAPAPVDPGAVVDAAVRLFARDGYTGARVQDIAAELRIAKGSIFKHFGSKEGLFLAAYKKAAAALPAYMDAPSEMLDRGFFATVSYWLERSEHLVHEDWVPYRVVLIGNYATDLRIKQRINRWLADEDPYGTAAFVRFGLERGEIRGDIDAPLTVSIVDWLMERFQDALVTHELDPGLFAGQGASAAVRERIDQFMTVLQGAIGTPTKAGT